MRRWNGWGDEHTRAQLPASAQEILKGLIGEGTPQENCPFEQVLNQVPASRLPDHKLISKDPGERLRHARGQSLPDWIALRSGMVPVFPDAVAFPAGTDDLRTVLAFALEHEARVIPYGGGTSVAGHINPTPGDSPVLTVSLARMNSLLRLQEENLLATFGAGVAGPDLEAALRAHGYTLGHYPQSFEYSTLGGWVVTRSAGQQSLGFGRIEDMFAGGLMLSPAGDLVLPPLPASSAGPDLRQMVLGSEGRMGILAEVTVRIRKLPDCEQFHALFFPDWDQAKAAVRELSQSRYPLSMMRLSNATETTTNLALAGKEKTVGYLKRFLALRGVHDQGCMLLMGFSDTRRRVKRHRSGALALCKRYDGVHLFQPLGRAWQGNRFRAPYMRNHLWNLGYAVDTVETCVTWDRVDSAVTNLEKNLAGVLEGFGEKAYAFTHLSHFYPSGCSLYTTYMFRIAATPKETLARWQALKATASETILAHAGTISHQHGVGTDHRNYLEAEKSTLGIGAIQQMCQWFDPKGHMNPGKLVE